MIPEYEPNDAPFICWSLRHDFSGAQALIIFSVHYISKSKQGIKDDRAVLFKLFTREALVITIEIFCLN